MKNIIKLKIKQNDARVVNHVITKIENTSSDLCDCSIPIHFCSCVYVEHHVHPGGKFEIYGGLGVSQQCEKNVEQWPDSYIFKDKHLFEKQIISENMYLKN